MTEGHREGLDEPTQRQRAATARPSAATQQHLFYSAGIRNTKGHKVPIHQRERVMIMLMRCARFVLPSKQGNGSEKKPRLEQCSGRQRHEKSSCLDSTQTGRNTCCRSGWRGIRRSVGVTAMTRACRVTAAACPGYACRNRTLSYCELEGKDLLERGRFFFQSARFRKKKLFCVL